MDVSEHLDWSFHLEHHVLLLNNVEGLVYYGEDMFTSEVESLLIPELSRHADVGGLCPLSRLEQVVEEHVL